METVKELWERKLQKLETGELVITDVRVTMAQKFKIQWTIVMQLKRERSHGCVVCRIWGIKKKEGNGTFMVKASQHIWVQVSVVSCELYLVVLQFPCTVKLIPLEVKWLGRIKSGKLNFKLLIIAKIAFAQRIRQYVHSVQLIYSVAFDIVAGISGPYCW